jgi:hypothetical protein
MRRLILCAVLVGCGGEDDGIPDDCALNHMHFVHDLDGMAGEGDVTLQGFAFINFFGDEPGTLDIGFSGTAKTVHIEFRELLADGEEVPARGEIHLTEQAIEVGNCDTAELSGTLGQYANGDAWKWKLVDLHASPFCTGAAITGSFAGCFRAH